MRRFLNLALLTFLVVAVAASPALAKKAPVQRTVIDGVTLAEVKPSSQMDPFYPATARTSKPYAVVVVAVEIDEKGKVSNAEVITSSVEGMGFEMSARDAVKQWRFHPALENDVAIDSVSVVRLTFAPPTLRRPDGFVFTERSPRFFAVRMFEDVLKDRTWTQAFAGTTSSADHNNYYFASELPPCAPTRNGNECTYDRSQLRQFNPTQDVALPQPYPPPAVPGDGSRR